MQFNSVGLDLLSDVGNAGEECRAVRHLQLSRTARFTNDVQSHRLHAGKSRDQRKNVQIREKVNVPLDSSPC